MLSDNNNDVDVDTYINTSLKDKEFINNRYWIFFNKSKAFLQGLKFTGELFRTAYHWEGIIPITDKKIRYLEIGAYRGINAITFCEIYGKNNLSEIHCIDPWSDYDDYPEYKGLQMTNYDIFNSNLGKYKDYTQTDKFRIHKSFSNEQLIKFPDEYFDIIYIDGNHEADYVLEDAVLSFRKLKKGGYMIFDDICWESTDVGICCFLKAYEKNLKIITFANQQLFITKN